MKRIKSFENSEYQTFWMVKFPDPEGHYEDSVYLFDNEKDLFNYVTNYIYDKVENCYKSDKEIEEYLTNLDEIDDYYALKEYYDDLMDFDVIDRDYRFYIDSSTLEKNVELEDWIELRRKAKKYNI